MEAEPQSPKRNIDTVKAHMREFLRSFPDLKVENLAVFGRGDTVIIMGDWSGTFKVALGPMKPTGKTFHIPDADIYTFKQRW
jgi:hypothetical protein